MASPPFDVELAHRYFAVECNNVGWDLLELPERPPDQQQRMIHAAHAACFHWLQVGQTIHHFRAQCLLAAAYAAAGLGEAAIRHADQAQRLLGEADDRATPFDRASAAGCAAVAYAAGQQDERARAYQARAAEAADALEDADERAVIHEIYLNATQAKP